MSASNEWTEWHLTPAGWVAGSRKTDFADATDVPRPADAVMSCTFSDYWASAFSTPDRNTTIDWKSKDTALVESLLKKFGKCPELI